MSANVSVGVAVANVARGPGSQSAGQFVAQSMSASFAWGSNPGTATIVYVAPNAAWTIATGALCALTFGAHYFVGICKSDVENLGSGEGLTRTLQFADLRDLLTWDFVFCAFNKAQVTLVNGVRVKRYMHIYPADYGTLTWTYTNSALDAWAMLAAILNFRASGLPGGVVGGTIGSPWAWDLTGGGLFPAGLFNCPVYEFDCLNGKRLDAVLNDFCERSGCVFGLFSVPANPYQLVFTRKGYGNYPLFPDNSDNRRVGVALSGHPTNVRVLGERNLYQVMDVPMQADWAEGWEDFTVFEEFADDIYHRAGYDATPNDPEQYIGRQLATARALTITVREYVVLLNATGDDGTAFTDNRKFAGRWRMDMPAALYISTLLWRAFRPSDEFVFFNSEPNSNLTPPAAGPTPLFRGFTVPLQSLDIADKLLCKVYQNDPTTGTMQFDASTPTDGNGYAMAKGYMVGADLFKTLSSAQFNLDFFKNATAVWQHVPFQIDDSGEEVRFIIFDEPVILSEDLIMVQDGHKVINAQFTLTVPSVSAALTFEAERFSYWAGTYPDVSRDSVENVGGLNLEAVVQSGFYTEIPYADGVSAYAKANLIAQNVLLRQYEYSEGGFKFIWQPGTPVNEFGFALSSQIDRVQITMSPREVTSEVVDLTNERGRDHFEPERELDRRTQTNSLFPGQAELRVQAEYARKLASAFKQLPGIRRSLSDLISGQIGSDQPLTSTYFGGAAGTTPIPVGTVIRKIPTDNTGTQPKNTIPVAPAQVATVTVAAAAAGTPGPNVFVGVTVRDQEDPTMPFKVQSTGKGLALVQGPVNINDPVGLSDGTSNNTCLVKSGPTPVGNVLQAITDTTIKLVEVMLGVGGSSSTQGPFQIQSVQSDYVTCFAYDPDTEKASNQTAVYIAKEEKHQNSLTAETIFGIVHNYTYQAGLNPPVGLNPADSNNPFRIDSYNSTQEVQRIVPPWICGASGDIIMAFPARTGVMDPHNNPTTLMMCGRSCQWGVVNQ